MTKRESFLEKYRKNVDKSDSYYLPCANCGTTTRTYITKLRVKTSRAEFPSCMSCIEQYNIFFKRIEFPAEISTDLEFAIREEIEKDE